MVSAIRSAKATTVRVTNYRKDGSEFVNVLTLHPVHDSESEYRYSIGILADGAEGEREGAALERLRGALPSRFDVALQPRQFAKSLAKVDVEAQRARLRTERESLLSAGYPAEDPLVRDLDRLIAAAE